MHHNDKNSKEQDGAIQKVMTFNQTPAYLTDCFRSWVTLVANSETIITQQNTETHIVQTFVSGENLRASRMKLAHVMAMKTY